MSSSQDRTTQIHKEIFTVTFQPSFCLLKARSLVDFVISVIDKTVFVLILLFDIEKVCRTKIFTKNKNFFASSSNDRGLRSDDKKTDYLIEIPEVKYIRFMRSHNTGNIHGENLHI